MRSLFLLLLVLAAGGTGCSLSNPDATPDWNGRALADLEALSVRTVVPGVARPHDAALTALLKAGCRILASDPAGSFITFSTSRRSTQDLLPRETWLEGTVRLHAVSDGSVRLQLVLGGRTVFHTYEKDIAESFSRASHALHVEFLDLIERALRG